MKALYVDRKFKQLDCIFHPFESFYEVKYKNKGSFIFTLAVLAVWFFIGIFQRQNTGYIFNHNKLNELNIFIIFIKTIILFFLWVVSNWAVATLMNGIGKFADIWLISAYSLIPYIAVSAAVTIISNVLTLNEGSFLNYLTLIGILWSSILMFIGLMIIHDYEFAQSIVSVIFTFFAMGIIIFLFVLFYTLINQFYVFLYTIFSEIIYRM